MVESLLFLLSCLSDPSLCPSLPLLGSYTTKLGCWMTQGHLLISGPALNLASAEASATWG